MRSALLLAAVLSLAGSAGAVGEQEACDPIQCDTLVGLVRAAVQGALEEYDGHDGPSELRLDLDPCDLDPPVCVPDPYDLPLAGPVLGQLCTDHDVCPTFQPADLPFTPLHVHLTGDAHAPIAVSGNGTASCHLNPCVQASVLGDAVCQDLCAAASAFGDAGGPLAMVAVSGAGDAQGVVAVSVGGDAEGGVALSGCDLAGLCF